MFINDKGFFESDKAETSVYAMRARGGRWQYRAGGPKGHLIASGMEPAAFVKSFWYRDDYREASA